MRCRAPSSVFLAVASIGRSASAFAPPESPTAPCQGFRPFPAAPGTVNRPLRRWAAAATVTAARGDGGGGDDSATATAATAAVASGVGGYERSPSSPIERALSAFADDHAEALRRAKAFVDADGTSPAPAVEEKDETPMDFHRALLEARFGMEARAKRAPPIGEDADGDVVVMSRKASLDSPLAEAMSSFVTEHNDLAPGAAEEEEEEEAVDRREKMSSSSPQSLLSSDGLGGFREGHGEEAIAASEDALADSEEGFDDEDVGDAEGSAAADGGGDYGSLTHRNIQWRLRPPRETSLRRRLSLRLAANVMRLACRMRGEKPPWALCPKGGQAVLEAHYKVPGKRFRARKQIARFGITTKPGPPSAVIDATVRELYGAATPLPLDGAGVAAIIYMFVEPDFRGRGVGELALEVVSAIHTVQGCDFTVLVADDDGSGRLVEWYEANGFERAPRLQEMMGSPGGRYGTTMIAPTGDIDEDFFERCKIKWW